MSEVGQPSTPPARTDEPQMETVDLGDSPNPAQSAAVSKDEASNGADFSLADTEVHARPTVPMSVRLQNIKSWGVTKVKCARQSMNERFGKATRTVDSEMGDRIETLREAQRNYQQIMALAKRLSVQLKAFLETQRGLADLLAEYGVRVTEVDLQSELSRGGILQRTVARSGEALVAALEHFVGSINTLLTKTMEDTFTKVREYEAARVQYDAYRIDVEQLQTFCDANPSNSAKQAKLEAAHIQFEAQKASFTITRNELSVKLKFLDENRVTVMQRQLVLLHNATAGLFSGNVDQMERCMKTFHIRMQDLSVSLPTSTDMKAVLTEVPVPGSSLLTSSASVDSSS